MDSLGQHRQELAHVRLHGPSIADANRHRKIGEMGAVRRKSAVEVVQAARETACTVAGTIPDPLSSVQARTGDLLPDPTTGVDDGRAPGPGPALSCRANFPRMSRVTTGGLGSL